MRKEWQEGYKAAEEGKSAVDDNPYDFDSEQHKLWFNGYCCWLDENDEA